MFNYRPKISNISAHTYFEGLRDPSSSLTNSICPNDVVGNSWISVASFHSRSGGVGGFSGNDVASGVDGRGPWCTENWCFRTGGGSANIKFTVLFYTSKIVTDMWPNKNVLITNPGSDKKNMQPFLSCGQNSKISAKILHFFGQKYAFFTGSYL